MNFTDMDDIEGEEWQKRTSLNNFLNDVPFAIPCMAAGLIIVALLV